MKKFIQGFLIFIVLYHILVTVIRYGIFWWINPELPAIIRDCIRLIFIVAIFIYYFRDLKDYFRQWKRPRISFIILVIFSVGISYIKGKNVSDMLVGIKYGFLYIPIFLSATFIGYIWNEEKSWIMHHASWINNFFQFIKSFLIITLIAGFFRQVAKFFRPDFFLHIGYGPFNDFVFGAKPPIYYLTGYKGTPRWQGLFSGPNNYGYFLIAFLPLIVILCKNKIKSLVNRAKDKIAVRNMIVIILRIAAILLTLSRSALVGWIVAIALLNFKRIRKNKKIARWVVGLVMLWLAGLSILKRESTRIHLTKFLESISYIIQQPNWYGLGTSWPAIHHNGTLLPENYFFQLILDIGTIGFIIRIISIRQIQIITRRIKNYFTQIHSETDIQIYRIRIGLTIGRIALLIMGFFLHVFEDSMVNYIFFILWGVSTWYLFSQVKDKW
jgi:hypothetical protein